MSELYDCAHPHAETGNAFIEDARVVYGDEGALIISDAIITGLQYAQALLPPKNPNDVGLRLAIMNPPEKHDGRGSVHGWASGPDNEIALMINPDASVPDIALSLYYTVPHEYGHLVHHQTNPDFGAELKEPSAYRLFKAAVKEGIARCAESMDHANPYREAQKFYTQTPDITSELPLLLDPGFNRSEHDVYEFLYGRVDGITRPYGIGHFIVASLAISQDYDLPRLMQAPLGEFIDFAETELL